MKQEHLTGASVGAIIGVLFVGLAHHYGVHSITVTDGSLIGIGCAAAGVALAHAVWTIGLGPIFSRIVHGPAKPSAPAPPVPPPVA